jgi:hypothetical protein
MSHQGDLNQYPALRRYLTNGFNHRPERDAPKFGMLCLESANQRVFVDPETGYERVGLTVRA